MDHFFNEFCKQFTIHLLIRSQRYWYLQYRPELTIVDQKFYLIGRLTNAEDSLPVAITARMGQSGRPLVSNPDSCKIISKSDKQFLRRRLFKNFFMSVLCIKPPFSRAMFKDRSKFRKQYFKRVTQGTFL